MPVAEAASSLNQDIASVDDLLDSDTSFLQPSSIARATIPGVGHTVDQFSPHPAQTPLLLTAQQKRMVQNLNESLPQMERIIAFFPWAFNAHALLIAR